MPALEATTAGTTLLIETSGQPESMAPAARRLVQDAAAGTWIAHVVTLQEDVRVARILDEFGAAGGSRMALGAEPRDVTALLQWQILRPVLVGVLLGLAGGVVLGRVMASLLFGVEAYDPVPLGALVLAELPLSLTDAGSSVRDYWPGALVAQAAIETACSGSPQIQRIPRGPITAPLLRTMAAYPAHDRLSPWRTPVDPEL